MTGSAAWSGNALGLLNALEGIAYIVDTEGQVVAVGAQAWNEAAEWGGASSDISAEAVIGTNLFDAVSGGPVRAIARRIHEYVCTGDQCRVCLLYTSPSPRDQRGSRMPSSA